MNTVKKQTAVVVAPGRGTYNKEELGYLHRWHAGRMELFRTFDRFREANGRPSMIALDGEPSYSVAKFTRGDNAAALTFSASYADFLSIDTDRFDVVALTGNSMGWYTALACAGALGALDGFQLADVMGAMMHEALIGGQMIYPFVDENWQAIPGKRDELLSLIDEVDGLHLSIDLGGMIVFGGDADGLAVAEKRLAPTQGRYPMRLANHAAFHTRLQEPVAHRARNTLDSAPFRQPAAPLIDGRGEVWTPHSTDPAALWDYTLGHQIFRPYDFTRSIRNSVREFAPDVLIVLGPGRTLGGAIAQALIGMNWRGLDSKQAFLERQQSAPVILSMGIDDQRRAVTAHARAG